MSKVLATFGLLACLALIAAGCGSDDDASPSVSATPASANSGAEGGDAKDAEDGAREPAQSGTDGSAGEEEEGASAAGGVAAGKGGKAGDRAPGASGLGEARRRSRAARDRVPPARAAAEFEIREGADNSIQEYGSEATGTTKSAVVSAMYSFFRALANSDYAGICAGLTSANVEQLEMFLKLKDKSGSCETVLQEVLNTQTKEARQALAGTVYQVREEGGNAFVLFVPAGGKASYFVMKDENGSWKATSVTAGTPLNPGA